MENKRDDIFNFVTADVIGDDRFELVDTGKGNNDIFVPKQKEGEDYPNWDIVKDRLESQKEALINVLNGAEYEKAITFITGLRRLMLNGLYGYLASRLIELHPILKGGPIYVNFKIAGYTIPMEISYDPEHGLASTLAHRISCVFQSPIETPYDQALSRSYNYGMPINYHLSCIVYNQNYEPIMDASIERMPQYIKAQFDKNTYFMNAMQLLPEDREDQFNIAFKEALIDTVKKRIK